LDTGHVQLKVRDTGRGIPTEALPYVFQKFFHVDKTLTRPYGGMGLGLAYCKEVIEAHNGRIWVESKGHGEGSTVSFLLPSMNEPVPSAAPTSPAPVRSGESKKTILWVDDNPNLLELVEYGFAGFPHPVNLLTAQGGVAALAQLKTDIPDLVVLDIMMSDMDGLEVLTRLRNDPQSADIPILVVSGYREAAKIAVEKGATDFCLKPFRLQDVLKKIESLLYASTHA
jgi:CheY-like chemotaxis protein